MAKLFSGPTMRCLAWTEANASYAAHSARISIPCAKSARRRRLHTANTCREEYKPQQPRLVQKTPRWQETPPRMTAPYRSKPPVFGNDYHVNDDPAALDEVYTRTLGEAGDKLLSEEVKWLAVTHKSFDHGRRGFNDRLAFLGKRIVDLQASLSLVHRPSDAQEPQSLDPQDRQPFMHPALEGLDNLTAKNKSIASDKDALARLGKSYGLDAIIRWKPKRATRLEESGLSLVVQQALYAIVGAVALEKGGNVANAVARDRILGPLGLQQGE